MRRYVAVDVGGTQIKHGILEERGRFLEKASMDTPAQEGGKRILSAVLKLVEGYRERMDVDGVCISSAGVVDCKTGTVVYAGGTIPGLMGTNYKKAVEERFGLPCEVENDVNCAGLAEYRSGAGAGSRVMACLTVGTGIGGCAVIDGRVLHGASHSAMEIGYLPIEGREFQDQGAAMVLSRRVAQAKGDSPADWDGKRIFAAARAGDESCIAAVDELCEVLGKGIAAVCYVLNPDTVVLGGGIMAQSAYLEPRIRSALQRSLRPMVYEPIRLRFAAHQNDAGMLGALYHFLALHPLPANPEA